MAYSIQNMNYDLLKGFANVSISEPNTAPGDIWTTASVSFQVHPPLAEGSTNAVDQATIKAKAKEILLAAAAIL